MTRSQLSSTLNNEKHSVSPYILHTISALGEATEESRLLPATINIRQQSTSSPLLSNISPFEDARAKDSLLLNISDVSGADQILRDSQPIKKFLLLLATTGSFSIGGLKRGIHKLWCDKLHKRDTRPDHLSAKAMFDPQLFICGKSKVDSNLVPTAMARFHRCICVRCRLLGFVHPDCYF